MGNLVSTTRGGTKRNVSRRYAKQKNIPQAHKGDFGYGDVWTWTAMDADAKLIVSYAVGLRDAGYAHEFIQDVADRLPNRVHSPPTATRRIWTPLKRRSSATSTTRSS